MPACDCHPSPTESDDFEKIYFENISKNKADNIIDHFPQAIWNPELPLNHSYYRRCDPGAGLLPRNTCRRAPSCWRQFTFEKGYSIEISFSLNEAKSWPFPIWSSFRFDPGFHELRRIYSENTPEKLARRIGKDPAGPDYRKTCCDNSTMRLIRFRCRRRSRISRRPWRQLLANDTEKLFRDFACQRGSEEKYIEKTGTTERTIYQHDVGQITYCTPFRKLAYISHLVTKRDATCRTKLIHSLEVETIAVEIANALGLDLTLTRAIALGHDIGSYPYGRVGESQVKKKFETVSYPDELTHQEMGYRILSKEAVITVSEREEGERFNKLNDLSIYDIVTTDWGDRHLITISKEALEGIRLHQPNDYRGYESPIGTLEAQVVRVADNFAYVTQELADAQVLKVDLEPYSKRPLYCDRRSPQPKSQSNIKAEQSYTWAELQEIAPDSVDPRNILSSSTGDRLNSMIYWFIEHNKQMQREGSLSTIVSKNIGKEIPILEYPEGLGFLCDFVWSAIITRKIHDHPSVQLNRKIAENLVSFYFDILVDQGTERIYEDDFKKELDLHSDSSKYRKMFAAAVNINRLTDFELEKELQKLWEYYDY